MENVMQLKFVAKLSKLICHWIVLTMLVIALPTQAQVANLDQMPAGNYALDIKHASILWKVSHFGFSTYPGRFTEFEVDLNLDPITLQNSSVSVKIKADSIKTAYPFPEQEDFDAVLAKDWFKAEEFPDITFKSTAVSALSGNNFSIEGELSMMGKTLPATLQATLNKATTKHPLYGKPVIGFSAVTTLDRTQWGQTKYAPGIGAEVTVEIEGEFGYEAN
jgi:polyisoprenoid-binding protein YceI